MGLDPLARQLLEEVKRLRLSLDGSLSREIDLAQELRSEHLRVRRLEDDMTHLIIHGRLPDRAAANGVTEGPHADA